MSCNFNLFRCALKALFVTGMLLSGLAGAQNLVRGVVREKPGGALLANVAIRNYNLGSGSNTNDSGFYKILGNTGDVLEFSKTGYTSVILTLASETTVLNVELEKSENPLDEVVISASRSDQSLKNTSVSMEVIKPYLIQNKNPATAENTLDQIPGVQAVNGQVVIRSGSGWSYGAGTRVMVMVDGMPMISGDASQVQWSFLPVENVESIEVIKGASSVLFGSSALNGVINIRTSKPKLKPETQVSAFYGFYGQAPEDGLNWNNHKTLNTLGIRAFHSQKRGRNSYAFTLNGMKDDGYRMSDEDKRLRLGWQYQRDLKKLQGYAALNGNVQAGRSSSFLLWENKELGYTALDSNFTRNKTMRFNIDPVLVINRKGWKHLAQARFLKVSNEVLQVSTNLSQSNFSDFVFGEYQISRNLSRGIRMTGGLTLNFARSQSDLYQGWQTSGNKAAYLQLNQKTGKWNFDLGMRYEAYKLNHYKESKPVLRAGLSRELAKASFFRASFGQGYRFPTIAESYISTSVGPLKIYPNTDLKSESGWNAEIGIKQGVKAGKVSGILDVAAFWMEYNRMMEFAFGQWDPSSPTGGFGFKSLNVSHAQIRGIDVSFAGTRKGMSSELKWLAGYTYANAIATEPDRVFYTDPLGNPLSFRSTSSDPQGNYLKYRPKHLARLDIQYERKGWELGLSARYNSYLRNIDKAFVSFPIAIVVPGIQDMREEGKHGDYIFDLRLGKTHKQYKVLFIINNLLNRKYMTRPCDIRPPRTFIWQVSYTLR